MATGAKKTCGKCSRPVEQPRVMDCHHMFCEGCFNRFSNEYVMTAVPPEDRQKPPSQVPCDVCKKMSSIPTRGAQHDLVDTMAKVNIGQKDTSESGIFSPGSKRVKKSTKCELFWSNKDYSRYYDATFFSDNMIVFITYEKDDTGEMQSFTLRVLDHTGTQRELPFPVFITKPIALCGSYDGKRLAILDWPKKGEHKINIYTKTSRGWSSNAFSKTHVVVRVALLPDGGCVCTTFDKDNGCRVMLFDIDGEQVWNNPVSKPAVGETSSSVVFLSTTPSGYIVISDLNTDKVTIMDSAGVQLRQITSQFLKQPRGICVDTHGDVLVYDAANKTVSLFTIDGEYISKVLKSDVVFGEMCLYLDKYLLCGNQHGLYMYKLSQI